MNIATDVLIMLITITFAVFQNCFVVPDNASEPLQRRSGNKYSMVWGTNSTKGQKRQHCKDEGISSDYPKRFNEGHQPVPKDSDRLRTKSPLGTPIIAMLFLEL